MDIFANPLARRGLASAAALVLALTGSAATAEKAEYFPPETPGRPFSSAVRVGDILYLSGQMGTVRTGVLAEGGMPGETRQIMENLRVRLAKHGLTFDDVFKCTVMLADMKRWEEFNAIYVTYFKPERLPARSAFGANGLAIGGQVELECLAKFPD